MRCGSFESAKVWRLWISFKQIFLVIDKGSSPEMERSHSKEFLENKYKLTFFFPKDGSRTTLFQLNKKRSRHLRLTLNTVILVSVNRTVESFCRPCSEIFFARSGIVLTESLERFFCKSHRDLDGGGTRLLSGTVSTG